MRPIEGGGECAAEESSARGPFSDDAGATRPPKSSRDPPPVAWAARRRETRSPARRIGRRPRQEAVRGEASGDARAARDRSGQKRDGLGCERREKRGSASRRELGSRSPSDRCADLAVDPRPARPPSASCSDPTRLSSSRPARRCRPKSRDKATARGEGFWKILAEEGGDEAKARGGAEDMREGGREMSSIKWGARDT
ncbi:hypothetical protein KM043_012349 [Ampulex compressa]|nr:hypothetical protein KM043_012349 [Ampulex compressa]